MELKCSKMVVTPLIRNLLIVLNGIEISSRMYICRPHLLLIVLNGIEILSASQQPLCRGLLIVLNGIEIKKGRPSRKDKALLIVLNGIEMHEHVPVPFLIFPFNRTKWN